MDHQALTIRSLKSLAELQMILGYSKHPSFKNKPNQDENPFKSREVIKFFITDLMLLLGS